MIEGINIIGYARTKGDGKQLKAFKPAANTYFDETFSSAEAADVDRAVQLAATAFEVYRQKHPEEKAVFLETIASEIMALGDELLQRAHEETGLPIARLTGERARTCGQLKLFAEVLREGSWVEAVIDEAIPDRTPLPRVDHRKMLVPIGPVVVFGASNFPFAFSTAGGDTASALAAGNPVIVKAHQSHLGTNEMVATAISIAAGKCQMPDGVFSSLLGTGPDIGQLLCEHPGVKAIGFTGSYAAGMSLFETANHKRKQPIPVYAEMSSINPVVILPEYVAEHTEALAKQLAGSITLGVGQFCTNPGLIFLISSQHDEQFIQHLASALNETPAATMLNKHICSSYYENRDMIADHPGVRSVMLQQGSMDENKGATAFFVTDAKQFMSSDALQTEVFGPSSLLVIAENEQELKAALTHMHGQLTGSVFGSTNECSRYQALIEILQQKAGRIIFNGVPTGVEVCHAMVHGGPFPATSDHRYTSVGADAIKRFVRPVCWQNCPDSLLPEELKAGNPRKIMRKLNGRYQLD